MLPGPLFPLPERTASAWTSLTSSPRPFSSPDLRRPPFGIPPSPEYGFSVVYVSDAFFATYQGTSFSLPTFTLQLATTGDEVYFRHVSAINRSADAIEILLTRTNKSKRITVGNDPNAAALLEALRTKLRNPSAPPPPVVN